MDEIDLKDLQYQVVAYRKKAVQLITDINYAKSKNAIKEIKTIENEPINSEVSYKSLNIQRLKNIPIPEVTQTDTTSDRISDIRGVMKVLKRNRNGLLLS